MWLTLGCAGWSDSDVPVLHLPPHLWGPPEPRHLRRLPCHQVVVVHLIFEILQFSEDHFNLQYSSHLRHYMQQFKDLFMEHAQ